MADPMIQAVAEYKTLATSGDARAIGQLGYCIYNGVGGEVGDKAAGLALLERGAELDDIFSLYVLGCLCLSGKLSTGLDVVRGREMLLRIRGRTETPGRWIALINSFEEHLHSL